MFCPNCGKDVGDARFCPNCGTEIGSSPVKSAQQTPKAEKKKAGSKKVWIVVIVAFILMSMAIGTTKSSKKSPAEAANSLNSQIATTTKPTSNPKPTATVAPTPDAVLEEINPDIPLGTTYDLDQGVFECGVDIPAGRYIVEWVSGNPYGGYLSATKGGKYIGTAVSIDSNNPYTCILSAGDEFEISLSTYRFTKITSLPNDNYLQSDGSYLFGSGFFFEGIDIPEGKYNITAVGGNPYGIYVSSRNNSMISLKQDETYKNLKLDHTGASIEISLGKALFEPQG